MADTRPQSHVFNTFELLEGILVYVDLRTLLLAQRVNKTFHETITGSSMLQEKLSLKPLPNGSTYTLCTETNCICDETDKSAHHINPLLRSHGTAVPLATTDALSPRHFYVNPHSTPGHTSLRRNLVLEGGSWQRMLVSQPPGSASHVHYVWFAHISTWEHGGEPRTVGEVFRHFWPESLGEGQLGQDVGDADCAELESVDMA